MPLYILEEELSVGLCGAFSFLMLFSGKRIRARQAKKARNPPFFVYAFYSGIFYIVFLFIVKRLFVMKIVFYSVGIRGSGIL